MTSEELWAMDAEVHRKVFQRPVSRDADGWFEPLGDGRRLTVSRQPIPPYSGSMSSAWLVVERLTDEEYVKVRCEQSHYHGDYCSVTAADATQRDGSELVKRDALAIWGETMPLAVCRAALKAVGAVTTDDVLRGICASKQRGRGEQPREG